MKLSEVQDTKTSIQNAAIRVGDKVYEGEDHGQAINKASQAGEDVSGIDREKDGLFKTSDGRLINRDESKSEFGINHSHQIPDQQTKPLRLSQIPDSPNKTKTLHLSDIGATLEYPSDTPEDKVKEYARTFYENSPTTPLKPEDKQPFVEGISESIYIGVLKSATGFNRMIGLGSNDFTKNLFITSGESQVKELEAKKASATGAKKFAYELSEGLGHLAVDVPTMVATGVASKMALVGRVLPEVDAFLNGMIETSKGSGVYKQLVPDFALGMGEIGAVKSAQEGKGVAGAAQAGIEGLGMGLIYGSVGEGLKSIPQLAVIGVGEAGYNALKEGRFPTKDEIEKGAAQGAAYGVLFSIIPALKGATKKVIEKESQKNTWDNLTNAILKASKNPKEGFDEIHIAVEEVKNDPSIPAEHKQLVDDIINKEPIENPESGEVIFLEPSTKKGWADTAKQKLKVFFAQLNKGTETAKTLEEKFNKLRLAMKADELRARQFLMESGISNKDAEAIYHYLEDSSIELTPEQQDIYEKVVKPLKEEYERLYSKLRNDGLPMPSEGHTPRFPVGRKTVFDSVGKAWKRIGSGLLKMKSAGDKKRVMKALISPSGRRVVVSIKDGEVVAWREGKPISMGKFSLQKNIELLKEAIAPLERQFKKIANEIKILQGVKTRQPVSDAKMSNLMNKASDAAEFMENAGKEENEAFKKSMKKLEAKRQKFKDKIDALKVKKSDVKSVKVEFEDGTKATIKPEDIDTLSGLESEIKTVEYQMNDGSSKSFEGWRGAFNKEYIEDLKISLDEVSDKIYELTDKHRLEGGDNKAAVERAADNLKSLKDEIRTLSKVGKAEDVILRKNRLDNLQAKLDKAQQHINDIISGYDLEELNDKVFEDKDGKRWQIGDATTKEIEANTNVRYHKNVILNYLERIREYKKIDRATQFLDEIKNSPEFSSIGIKDDAAGADKRKEEGWKPTSMPQFRGHLLDPRVADALDLFSDKLYGRRDNLHLFTATNGLLRTAIFFNAFMHIPNITVHWAVNRGAMKWAMPNEYATLFKTGSRAWDAVTKLNSDYIEMMESGANLMYSDNQGQTLHDMYASKMSEDLQKLPKTRTEMALDVAMTPAKLVSAWYKMSGNMTWASNDIAMMQAVYEEMEHGRTLQESISEVSKHIPNYVLPSRIFNSTEIAEIMRNSNITMFGAYHYGALKSYGEMMKSLAAGTGKEKLEVMDKLAALAIIQFMIYPSLDKVAQSISGDKKAHLRRAGATTLPDNLIKLFEHKIDSARLVQSVATPSIGANLAIELYENRDQFTGKRLIQTNQEADDLARIAVSSVAPAEAANRILEGKTDIGKTLAGFVGVSFSDENTSKVFNLKESKQVKQKKFDLAYKNNPEKAIADVSKFNEAQLKDMLQVLEEEGITPRKELLNQVMITKVGDRPTQFSLEKYLSKQKRHTNKPIQYTSEQKQRIDEIMKKAFKR